MIVGSLFAVIKRTNIQYLVVIAIQTIFISAMSTVTQHTPARAVVFVALASFAVGAQQVVGLLIIQFGVEDHQIGVATGFVPASFPFSGKRGMLTIVRLPIGWQDLFERLVVLSLLRFIVVSSTLWSLKTFQSRLLLLQFRLGFLLHW